MFIHIDIIFGNVKYAKDYYLELFRCMAENKNL